LSSDGLKLCAGKQRLPPTGRLHPATPAPIDRGVAVIRDDRRCEEAGELETAVAVRPLSNWLVNKAKENPKAVQGILGHARIQTILDLYTDEDLDEVIAAQEKFLDAVGSEEGSVQ
jgi:hypothetical protein